MSRSAVGRARTRHRQLVVAGIGGSGGGLPTGPCGSTYTAGKAQAFNGSTGFLSRPTSATLDATGNSAFLIAGWVLITAKSALYIVAGKTDNDSLALDEWALGYFNGSDCFYFARTDTANNNAGAFNTNGSPITLGAWQFVAGWFNGSNQVGCSKDNGSANVNAVAGTTATNRSAFTVGSTADLARFLPGRVAHLAYLKPSAANIAARVTSLYNGGVPKGYADLTAAELADMVAFWECHEETGQTTVCDWHTNNQHLTINGGVTQAAGP